MHDYHYRPTFPICLLTPPNTTHESPGDYKLCERALDFLDRCYQNKLEFLQSVDEGLVLFDESHAMDLKHSVKARFELLRLNVCKVDDSGEKWTNRSMLSPGRIRWFNRAEADCGSEAS